jgi:hypothetical protein
MQCTGYNQQFDKYFENADFYLKYLSTNAFLFGQLMVYWLHAAAV